MRAQTPDVHGAAKVPFLQPPHVRAAMLGLAETAVDLIEVDVGGGFGARGEFYPEDFLIPFAARLVGAACAGSRIGANTSWRSTTPARCMRMWKSPAGATARSSACAAMSMSISAHMSRTNGFTAPRNVVQFMAGPYCVPNIALDAAVYVTNKTPTGTYRGPGRFEASYFCERLFDMAAHDLGIDPAEFRRSNLLPKSSCRTRCPPSWTSTMAARPNATTARMHRLGSLPAGIRLDGEDQAARPAHRGPLSRHRRRLLHRRRRRRSARERAHGVELDGRVSVHVGSSAIGQGLETVLAQIAADALGLPMDRVRLLHGSTTLVQRGLRLVSFAVDSDGRFGNPHRRGGAAWRNPTAQPRSDSAARRMRCRLATARSHMARRVSIFLHWPGLPWSALITTRSTLIATAAMPRMSRSIPAPGTWRFWITSPSKMSAASSTRRRCMGRSSARWCRASAVYFSSIFNMTRTAQLLTGSLADYLLPTATDFPNIRGISLALRPCPNNPLGAKGAGEGGLIVVGGVIGNAIAAALRSLRCAAARPAAVAATAVAVDR